MIAIRSSLNFLKRITTSYPRSNLPPEKITFLFFVFRAAPPMEQKHRLQPFLQWPAPTLIPVQACFCSFQRCWCYETLPCIGTLVSKLRGSLLMRCFSLMLHILMSFHWCTVQFALYCIYRILMELLTCGAFGFVSCATYVFVAFLLVYLTAHRISLIWCRTHRLDALLAIHFLWTVGDAVDVWHKQYNLARLFFFFGRAPWFPLHNLEGIFTNSYQYLIWVSSCL